MRGEEAGLPNEKMPHLPWKNALYVFYYIRTSKKNTRYTKMGHFVCFIAVLLTNVSEKPFFPKEKGIKNARLATLIGRSRLTGTIQWHKWA